MATPHDRFSGAHFASFWKCFDEPIEPLTVKIWRIKKGSRLANAIADDALWLFTSGRKCKSKLNDSELPAIVGDELAYLAEVFTVKQVIQDKVGEYDLCVRGLPKRCLRVNPPLLIDDIVRPGGHESDEPIGSLRQGAWRLKDEMADQLCRRLQRDAPSLYTSMFARS